MRRRQREDRRKDRSGAATSPRESLQLPEAGRGKQGREASLESPERVALLDLDLSHPEV